MKTAARLRWDSLTGKEKAEREKRGEKKKPQPGLYRLVASATLPPTNQIRDENKDDEETEGHAHCNGHQKAQIRVQEALFS